MPKLDLKIINGTLATSECVSNVDIGIKGGRIASLGNRGELPEADQIMDIKGKFVLPGGIDTHVHAGDPGLFDFTGSSKSAALGGITTFVDMPIQIPLTENAATFDQKMESINSKAYVDFALWGTCQPDNPGAIAELKEKGVVGIKLVMELSAEIMPQHNDGAMLLCLREADKNGLVSIIHAENAQMIGYLEEKLKKEGREDVRAFFEAHPVISELEAVNRTLFVAKHVNASVCIAHCSIAEGIDLIYQAKKDGVQASVETCPHYLLIDDSIADTRGGFSKISPPLRDKAHVDMLWEKLKEGKIDCIGSDHAPWPAAYKASDNIWEVAAGSPGIQTMHPLLIHEGLNNRGVDITRLVKVMSEGPAKVCGLYPRKGSAMIGADADFSIYNFDNVTEVKLSDQIDIEWTLYEGMKAIYPDATIVRGRVVMDRGQIIGEKGYGELITS